MSAATHEQAETDQPGGLERIGETAEFGSLLVRLATLSGWQLRTTGNPNGGHCYWLERAGVMTPRRTGRCLAEVAPTLVTDAFARADATPPQEGPIRVSSSTAGSQ